MAQGIENEPVGTELRYLLDELAARSMSGLLAGAEEAQAICERFAIITRLASEADLHDVAAVGESLQKGLASSDVGGFLPCLRDAVTQIQGQLGLALGEQQAFTAGRGNEMNLADPDRLQTSWSNQGSIS